MTEQSEYRLPDNTYFPAVLESVSVRTVSYTSKRDGKEQSFDKWEWEFKITDGDYAGMVAYGETEDRLTTREDNKVRYWAEALRGVPFELGEGLDTDDLIGLPCTITVEHGEPREKRDGGMFYPCPVHQVWPEGTKDPDEAPF